MRNSRVPPIFFRVSRMGVERMDGEAVQFYTKNQTFLDFSTI